MDSPGNNGPVALSPSEERIIDYVRAGTLDAEIAVRLGVPVGEVKDRTARLLQKLDLPDRAALATWRPSGAPPPSSIHPTDPARADPATTAAGAPPPQRSRFLAIALGGLVAAAAVGAVGAIAFLSDNAPSDPEGEVPPALTATALAVPGPTANTWAAVSVDGLTVVDTAATGPAFEVANVQMLVLQAACGDCGSSTPRVARIWRLSIDHAIQTDVLLDSGLGRTVLGAVAGRGGGEIHATVCYFDACPGGPVPVRSAVLHSVDGGVTWSETATLDGAYTPLFDSVDGLLLSRATVDGSAAFEYFPSGAAPPEGLVPVGVDASGKVVWLNGAYRLDVGDTILPNPILLTGGPNPVDGSPVRYLQAEDAAYIVAWRVPRPGSEDSQGVLTRVTSDGRADRAINSNLQPVTASGNLLFGHGPIGPAVLDLDTNTLYSLHGPWRAGLDGGASSYALLSLTVHPYARVINLDGPDDCLNIRDNPTTTATVLICVRETVHLQLEIGRGGSGGPEWVPVLTPAGEPGWAHIDYLDLDGLE